MTLLEAPAAGAPGLPLNQVQLGDALAWCQSSLPDESVDCWWSSPPYNLADPMRPGRAGNKTYHRYAGGTHQGDGTLKPEDEYQDEQVSVLAEWYRTLRPDGVAFYSHKVRIKDGRAISPLAWIYRTPFVLLQELVWDRGGTQQVQDWRFLPVSERIYVLTKRPGLHLHNPWRLPDVLRFPPTHHKRAESGHPCPTHPSIVRACLSVLPRPKGRRPIVADCYGGSGTTGVIADELGMDWLLCDIAPAYVALARRRIAQETGWCRRQSLPLDLDAPALPSLEGAAGD